MDIEARERRKFAEGVLVGFLLGMILTIVGLWLEPAQTWPPDADPGPRSDWDTR